MLPNMVASIDSGDTGKLDLVSCSSSAGEHHRMGDDSFAA